LIHQQKAQWFEALASNHWRSVEVEALAAQLNVIRIPRPRGNCGSAFPFELFLL
jgi:hypothetical protein